MLVVPPVLAILFESEFDFVEKVPYIKEFKDKAMDCFTSTLGNTLGCCFDRCFRQKKREKSGEVPSPGTARRKGGALWSMRLGRVEAKDSSTIINVEVPNPDLRSGSPQTH